MPDYAAKTQVHEREERKGREKEGEKGKGDAERVCVGVYATKDIR